MAVRKIDHVADYLGSAGGFAVRCTSATTIYVTR
jgi:hypothetical protein